jgi:hypothetical protein
VVSSDPEGKDRLPDLCGAAVFAEFDSFDGKYACMTCDTGTVYLRVSSTNNRQFRALGEASDAKIDLNSYKVLDEVSNPTNWQALIQKRLQEL